MAPDISLLAVYMNLLPKAFLLLLTVCSLRLPGPWRAHPLLISQRAEQSTIFYWAVISVYRIYFHPLAKYPGPRLAAVSEIWYASAWSSGRYPHTIAALHKRYGDVIRIAPNELSFASVQALQDIYGHAKKGKKLFLKGTFHVQEGETHLNLVSERDPIVHARKKSLFINAFSSKALSVQQDVTKKYINLFLKYIENDGSPSSSGTNMTQIYYWLTFDIIGDLSFGESFHALEDGKTSHWVELLSDAMHLALFHHVTQRLPIAKLAIPFIMPMNTRRKLELHKQLSREKMLKRIAMQDSIEREDFFSTILRKKADVPEPELINHAEILIIAGSETTANVLCGLTYYLLKHPEKFARLRHEVRSAFTTLEEITWDSTNRLPYLTAVIKEVLRVFSPAPFGAQRVCPGAMVDGHYIPEGTLVSVAAWTTHYDPRYWTDPKGFKPERWLNEDNSDVRLAFHPFSIGPRSCIGINLAYLEVRLTVASMILAYDWEWVNNDLNWEKECQHKTFWQIPPLYVRFRPRPQQF